MNLYSSILQHLGALLLFTALIYLTDWYKVLYFIIDRHTAVLKVTWVLLILYYTYLCWNNPEGIERVIACHMILFAVLFGKNRRQDYVAFRIWLEKLRGWISRRSQ